MERKFSKKFIKAVKESEEEYKKGNFISFKSRKKAKKYLDNL